MAKPSEKKSMLKGIVDKYIRNPLNNLRATSSSESNRTSLRPSDSTSMLHENPVSSKNEQANRSRGMNDFKSLRGNTHQSEGEYAMGRDELRGAGNTLLPTNRFKPKEKSKITNQKYMVGKYLN